MNDISLKFPEKGLIFILGKSGSGKSTLLNVMGGLDLADSGTIIIKGVSSNNFKQSDFDTYRNTYLGFVFQEYNILNEFNVKQNIGIALELQHKKPTNDVINNILKEVDLEGLGSRKPNELSGGQKQRVAIARALVKNPEIIFADEPTGALDSNTGKQIFDVLKKLSKTKLVVVVSHDREFAEQYGDRVIELMDGKVISDIEKNNTISNETKSGITLINDSVIKIEKGHDELTNEDLQAINSYLKANKNDEAYISFNQSFNNVIKNATHADNKNCVTKFTKTDESKIKIQNNGFKKIKSNFSFLSCIKMALSSLKVKPVRLIITILLTFTSFTFFGIADVFYAYDKNAAVINEMNKSDTNYATYQKTYKESGGYSGRNINMNDNDIDTIKDKTGLNYYKIIKNDYYFTNNFIYKDMANNGSTAYICPDNFVGMTYIDNSYTNTNFTLLMGHYPENKNEVLLTDYEYISFAKYGYTYTDNITGEKIKIEPGNISMDKLINKTLQLDKTRNAELPHVATFKICGFINTGIDVFNDYSEIIGKQKKLIEEEAKSDTNLQKKYSRLVAHQHYSFLCVGFVHKDYFDENKIIPPNSANVTYYNTGEDYIIGSSPVANISLSEFGNSNKDDKIIFLDSSSSKLQDTDIAVNVNFLSAYIPGGFGANVIINIKERKGYDPTIPTTYSKLTDLQTDCVLAGIYQMAKNNYNDAFNHHREPYEEKPDMTDEEKIDSLYNFYLAKYQDGLISEETTWYYQETLYNTCFELFKKYIQLPDKNDIFLEFLSKIDMYYTKEDGFSDYKYFEIGALYVPYILSSKNVDIQPNFTLNKAVLMTISNYNNPYSMIIAPIEDKNKSTISKAISANTYKIDIINDADCVFYEIKNSEADSVNSVGNLTNLLPKIFIVVACIFAIFSSLMLFNFISASINNKKREIGILRAVGARSKDIFNIFFSETIFIVLFDCVLAITSTFILSYVIDNLLINNSAGYISFNLLIPGIRQVLLLFAVALLVGLVSTLIPTLKISNKKPIEAIQNK